MEEQGGEPAGDRSGMMEVMKDDQVRYEFKFNRIDVTSLGGASMSMEVSIRRVGRVCYGMYWCAVE